MKNVITLTAACLLIFTMGFSGCVVEKDQETAINSEEGSLFIIGGGSRPEVMVQRMIDEAGLEENGYGIVLTMSGFNADTSGYYAERQFKNLGVDNIKSYDFGREDSVTESGIDSLVNAALIYITGGVQSRFMNAVKEHPKISEALAQALKSGAVISGTSAGAAVMSQIMITGDQNKHSKYTSTFYHLEKDNIVTAKGLGLIKDVIIDQHFVKRARNNRLLTAIMEYPEKTGIGIDESTAVLVKGNAVEVVGLSQVMVYQNKSDEPRTQNGKIAANQIQLDIYLPGDKFNLPK